MVHLIIIVVHSCDWDKVVVVKNDFCFIDVIVIAVVRYKVLVVENDVVVRMFGIVIHVIVFY